MTVELKPETERLVQEELRNGRVRSVDELIVEGVQAVREKFKDTQATKPKKNLAQFLLESPLRGSELRIERQEDYPRTVDL